jgi:hypothetical protein
LNNTKKLTIKPQVITWWNGQWHTSMKSLISFIGGGDQINVNTTAFSAKSMEVW